MWTIDPPLGTWSKKQSVISKSSMEAEFRAMSKGIDEAMWIKHLLAELKISYIKPIIIHCDNKSAISIAHDPVYHDRMKHVNIDKVLHPRSSGARCTED